MEKESLPRDLHAWIVEGGISIGTWSRLGRNSASRPSNPIYCDIEKFDSANEELDHEERLLIFAGKTRILMSKSVLHPIRGCFSSMDERSHLSIHPIRLVERICFKFHETELIPWMILSIHRLYYPTGGDLQNCATCATNLQRCIMTFASH